MNLSWFTAFSTAWRTLTLLNGGCSWFMTIQPCHEPEGIIRMFGSARSGLM